MYVLGGKECVTCERMSKKNSDGWEKLDDLPGGADVAKEYIGGLYSGALLFNNKVQILTRAKYLTLHADPEDISQERWNTQSYADQEERNQC